ncbi:phosphotransferase [Paenibacillus oenotherae]|uniref:Phosphotransferase n=1 Tax=Paenibacillus oenotherae TaxID=1435645 RepID=A0ABS7DAZ4_9BACL|nr:phosphotransferase [Paenibacillus oenotherae]MBW7476923.1 phosphotransferase [Paenibacillus oenotherae]
MDELMEELLRGYTDEAIDTIDAVPFGLTNYSRIVTIDKKKYVARIYDRYSKSLDRLNDEIRLLDYLEDCSLSFDVPAFLPARDGEKYSRLSNGQYGTMVRFIEGEPPDLSLSAHVSEYGRSIGEISAALLSFSQPVEQQEQGQQLRFYLLNSLHPLSNEQSVDQFVQHPPFEIDRGQLLIFVQSLSEVRSSTAWFERLPMGLVHHDLLIFNLLIGSDGKMKGILDYDFASYDVRALELAICINHLLQARDGSLAPVKLFVQEYRQFITLTAEEMESIPQLMRMYYTALLCIYIGQYDSGRDIVQYFAFILNQLVTRRDWLKTNEQELIAILKGRG